MRIEWRTVSACISRVAEDIEYDRSDRYADLEEIGIDEVSYQVGHSYVTVLVNHKKNEVIDVAVGHSQEVLDRMLQNIPEDTRNNVKKSVR